MKKTLPLLLIATLLLPASVSPSWAAAPAFDLVASFGPVINGKYPNCLILGKDGNFYGTTTQGGATDLGVFYRLTPAGEYTPLTSFHSLSLDHNLGIIQAKDGNFYGVNRGDATHRMPVIFRITPAGEYTTLAVSTSAYGGFITKLTEGPDGNLYGMSLNDGKYGYGAIYKITPAGKLTTVLSFPSGDYNPVDPISNLVVGKDGNLYGTSRFFVFKATLDGVLSTVATFPDNPTQVSDLLLASDGNLYGTTYSGGAGLGTIFKLTPEGVISNLYNFRAPNGSNPTAPLIEGKDGNLYGTCQWTTDHEAVFKVSLQRKLTLVGLLPVVSNVIRGNAQLPLLQGKDVIFTG